MHIVIRMAFNLDIETYYKILHQANATKHRLKVEIVPKNVFVILQNGLNGLNVHTRVALVFLQGLERFSQKTKHAMILWKKLNLVI